jgi:hypothetical protein
VTSPSGRPDTPNERWRAQPEPFRAVVVRDRADEQYLAVAQQIDRLRDFCQRVLAAGGLLNLSAADISRGTTDIDFFLLSLRWLLRVVELIRRSSLTTPNALRVAARTHESAVKNVTRVRDVLEHLDEVAVEGRGGIGYGMGPDSLSITHDGVTLNTAHLLAAAAAFRTAVRA